MRPEPLLLILMLGACNSAIGTDLTRSAARGVVNAEVQNRFPGAPVEPITDCIINNASSAEILNVASAAATGPTAQTTEIIGTVTRRPETIRCIGTDALPSILSSL